MTQRSEKGAADGSPKRYRRHHRHHHGRRHHRHHHGRRPPVTKKVKGTEEEDISTQRHGGSKLMEVRRTELMEVRGTELMEVRGTELMEVRGTIRVRGTELMEARGTELMETVSHGSATELMGAE